MITRERLLQIDEALEKNNVTLSQLATQDEELDILTLAKEGLTRREVAESLKYKPENDGPWPESHHTRCRWKNCEGDCFERFE